MSVKFKDGREITLPAVAHVASARQRHLLRSVYLKRKIMADTYRYLRATASPERRAEMRQQMNAARRNRSGWANV